MEIGIVSAMPIFEVVASDYYGVVVVVIGNDVEVTMVIWIVSATLLVTVYGVVVNECEIWNMTLKALIEIDDAAEVNLDDHQYVVHQPDDRLLAVRLPDVHQHAFLQHAFRRHVVLLCDVLFHALYD